LKEYNGYVNVHERASNLANDELIACDGYINVHLSAAQLATIVAQGNTGSNAP
jgi:hypothetical protein